MMGVNRPHLRNVDDIKKNSFLNNTRRDLERRKIYLTFYAMILKGFESKTNEL